jgi:hypothetical protein
MIGLLGFVELRPERSLRQYQSRSSNHKAKQCCVWYSTSTIQTHTQRNCDSKNSQYAENKKLNSVAFSPQANYTYRATAACWRS